MHFSNSLVAISLLASSHAFQLPSISSLYRRSTEHKPEARCPKVWYHISRDLTTLFLEDGQCNDHARAAIRAVFHDCFPSGGCDGSLALPEEIQARPNTPMAATVAVFVEMAKKYEVSVADVIVFAGSHAVATCPHGPTVPTYIGRKDSGVPGPISELPRPDVDGDAALAAFAAKGFSAEDLAALIGAHTASKQFVVDQAQAGAAQDTTPGKWDTLYFKQTIEGKAPLTFKSDSNLVQQEQVGPVMKKFSKNKAGWDQSFVSAMAKMGLLGTDGVEAMVDCTSALPRGHYSRDAKAAPVNARAV